MVLTSIERDHHCVDRKLLIPAGICKRCNVPISDTSIPRLTLRVDYIVCLRCYTTDRVDRLKQYLMLARRIAAMCTVDLGDTMVALMRQLLGPLALCESADAWEATSKRLRPVKLRELYLTGFTGQWEHAFSIVIHSNTVIKTYTVAVSDVFYRNGLPKRSVNTGRYNPVTRQYRSHDVIG